jgi:hypothetical protein
MRRWEVEKLLRRWEIDKLLRRWEMDRRIEPTTKHYSTPFKWPEKLKRFEPST